MNQTTVVGGLARLSQSKANLFYFSAEGNYTTKALLDMGIVICFECGHIGSIDDPRCLKCNADKFVLQSAVPQPKKWKK